MSNSIIILQVLGFLGTGALIVAGVAGAMWTASRGWAALSRNLAFGTFGLVLLYVALLVGGGMLSRGRILPLNAEKYFCELDCHLAYSVTDVRVADSLGTAEDGLRPNGRFWLVTVRTWFDPNTISARRSLTEPTWPAPRRVALVSAEGVRYPPVDDVDLALSSSGIVSTPITKELPPGASYTTTFVFDLPEETVPTGLLLTDDLVVSRFLIGHERSPFHAPTLLQLPSSSMAKGS
jgi:hypothetical protein